MIAKTKKFALAHTTYVGIAMKNIIISQWWLILLIGLVCIIPAFIWPDFDSWFIGLAITAPLLYLLFWLIQFAGATRLKEFEMIFQKLSYEIDSRQILMKIKANQGSQIPWSMIKKAKKGKNHFVLIMSKAQLIYLPFNVFSSKQHVQFVESILKRKELL